MASISIIALLISNCSRKTDLENQITITINSVDSETKQRRINTFDTIEVRKEVGIGFFTRRIPKVAEYVTDSMGSVKIKIDSACGYRFMLNKRGFYGSESFAEPFTKEKLKDDQEINIEAISLEKR
ncbi:hypothetical protein [Flavobacterium agrisoli]|uniref:Uncharacterized protein n=1 Tax=Flavobacterium agrisoli TaxID=2793066 RepID=A0A934PNI6_9FLAO|nr:hypothetical protein [Flavobacterium agrisoli]MBK0370178.1 hypothetical protein [Flavobacterium agrisoli]